MKFDITNVDMDIQLEAKGMTAHVEIVQGKAWITNVQLFLADHPYDAIWIQDDPIEIPIVRYRDVVQVACLTITEDFAKDKFFWRYVREDIK